MEIIEDKAIIFDTFIDLNVTKCKNTQVQEIKVNFVTKMTIQSLKSAQSDPALLCAQSLSGYLRTQCFFTQTAAKTGRVPRLI